MNCYIDIGGTNIRIAVYNNSIEIKKVFFNNNANSFFKIKSILEKLLVEFKINKTVVGMSGSTNYPKKYNVKSSQFTWLMRN